MRNEQAATQLLHDQRCQLREGRRARNHCRINAGQPGDERRDAGFRVNEGAPFACAILINLDETDLNDAVVGKVGTGRFQVDEDQRFGGKSGIHRLWPIA